MVAPTLVQAVRIAEQAGFSSFTVMDHYFQMQTRQSTADEPMLEGYTTLGYIAALTERMTLGLMVTGVMYRHPGLLAKTVTTLDVLSGGRAVLGIGASWYEREQRGLGVPVVPMGERFERLEEALQICLQMWSDDDAIEKTVMFSRPVLDDTDAFFADVEAYAKLGVSELQVLPDRHPVAFTEQVAERIAPRVAAIG